MEMEMGLIQMYLFNNSKFHYEVGPVNHVAWLSDMKWLSFCRQGVFFFNFTIRL